MSAFIHCVLRIDPDTLTEDEWHRAWGRVKFYLEIVHQVKFE
jgi:hypothetical protein